MEGEENMAKRSIWKGLCGAMVLALGACALTACGSQEAANGKTVVEMVSYKQEAVEVFGEIAKLFNETGYSFFSIFPAILKDIFILCRF